MAKSGDLENRGVDFSGVSLNLGNLMKSKENAVNGLTAGVAMLLKKNKVKYRLKI